MTGYKLWLVESFEQVEDPRVNRNKKHRLIDIIVIALCAVLSNANDWNEIETWGIIKEDWLRQFLELPNGIPSHDTFNRVFSLIDPKQFFDCFSQWIQAIHGVLQDKIIAIDGKALRKSNDSRFAKSALHLVSAWCADFHLTLGQVKTADKSNEITAMEELITLLSVKGTIITIDAMGCQKKIAALIAEKKGDYVLALKKNHKDLYEDISLFFNTLEQGNFKDKNCHTYSTVEKDHGRIEKRLYAVSNAIDWLPGKEEWKKLQSVAMVVSQRTINGKKSTERRYYISTLSQNPQQIARAIRSHWSIENNLHWQLDVTFKEDLSRSRTKNNAENFAALRRMAVTLLKQETSKKISMKCKRLLAGWDNNYLLKIIGFTQF